MNEMDAIDRARFSRVECVDTVAEAFRAKFGNPEEKDTQIIFEYLTDFCGYGANVTDPVMLDLFTKRTQVLMEIKKFLNCSSTFKIDEHPDEKLDTQDEEETQTEN